MKNAFLLAALMFVASCSAPQNKVADEQQSVEPTTAQVSAPVNYQPLPIPLKKDKFIQINIVVADIYQAAKAWAALLDIPVPEITTNKLRHSEEFPYTYRGNPSSCDLLVCTIDMGFDTERTFGGYPGSSWTIVDSEDVLGVNLNIKPKR
ncbi:MAG: hypothetical protein IKN48_00615 [Bacteroidaceae bacterium]|nr:hypothetical protein [Bacteroidaceae bacterium]MBR3624850.1 hypothetical protein [Bacteroidaceae bacterium]MBR3717995.1 hypothetical protein [Bacteroidaceae bacterium]